VNRAVQIIVRPASLITGLQRQIRASEVLFVVLAIAVGAVGGLMTVLQGAVARTLQHVLFPLAPETHLSASERIGFLGLLALPVGGALLAGFNWLTQARKRRLIDAVEANALHGGRMSLSDSLIVSGQTIISNGFGASVGLEAAYAQLGALIGALGGEKLRLRRGDLRILVGAGTAGAIAAAFGAPLAGAFYGIEIVIGAYTVSAIAPVAAAALAGALVAQFLGVQPYVIATASGAAVEAHHYIVYGFLGAICAGLGVALMQSVAHVERLSKRLVRREWARPMVGGVLLVPLAMFSPQTMSVGHGALHLDIVIGVPLGFLVAVLIAKALASILSLGFGFRGGLFFASLFLGTLIGHIFAEVLFLATGTVIVDPSNAALVGMAAFAVAVIGSPMAMAMLVLQATQDFALTGAVIAASLVASTIVREWFGFSFSTWRLHLRGESVKSARDVGWTRMLRADNLMRRETRATPAALSIADFRHRFPLGSTSRVVLVDATAHYAGIVNPAAAFAEGIAPDQPVGTLATALETTLSPEMDIVAIMRSFDTFGGDELAVVGPEREVLGLLTENYVRRRYAEEVDKAQRELFGEA
jgi:CIC family chloride channel protein